MKMQIEIELYPFEILEIGFDASVWHGRIKEHGSGIVMAQASGDDLASVMQDLRELSNDWQIEYWTGLKGD